jgi:hypothetical protein
MKIIIFIVLVAAAITAYFRYQQSALNPAVITNPVYAEVHMTIDAGNRTFEQVLFAQTVNRDDCKRFTDATLKHLYEHETSPADVHWTIKSAECKAELSNKYLQFFDNEPTYVTYLSVARGDPKEREIRIIYWGVSVAESDKVCNGVAQMQGKLKGAVKCIRAAKA